MHSNWVSTTSVSVARLAPLPPPPTPADQPVQSGLHHAEINETGEMPLELGTLPPMEHYNLQYV